MRSALISVATGVVLISTLAYADPPIGVGAAVTESGFECFFNTVVELGPGITPVLPGFGIVLTSTMENTKLVVTNSANGNRNLTCHGQIEFGSTITGFDSFSGQEVTATVAESFEEACDAINVVFPGVCKGGPNGAAVLNAENSGGGSCDVFGVETLDWQSVTTSSGRVMLTCLAEE